MVTRRGDGYEIDTDRERLDVARVHRWLSTDAYWALGRPADIVVASLGDRDGRGRASGRVR